MDAGFETRYRMIKKYKNCIYALIISIPVLALVVIGYFVLSSINLSEFPGKVVSEPIDERGNTVGNYSMSVFGGG